MIFYFYQNEFFLGNWTLWKSFCKAEKFLATRVERFNRVGIILTLQQKCNTSLMTQLFGSPSGCLQCRGIKGDPAGNFWDKTTTQKLKTSDKLNKFQRVTRNFYFTEARNRKVLLKINTDSSEAVNWSFFCQIFESLFMQCFTGRQP